MSRIITFRITEKEEKRIEYMKQWYKQNLPFTVEFTTTDIIKAAINAYYNDLISETHIIIKSNKLD